MKIISIIGGTGMLGAPVAQQLNHDGFKVRIITRDIESAYVKLGSDFEYRQADLTDVDSLKEALAGSDGVHINASGHNQRSYYQNHVIGTRNVLTALKGQNIQCISMISTASAYPEFDDRWDNKTKLEAETLLKQSDIPYLVFMPSWFMETLPLFRQKNKLVHIGPSTKPIHWISARDYAIAVSSAYQDGTCRNRRMPLYGPEGIRMADAMARYAVHTHLPVQKLPVWIAKVIGHLTRDDALVDVADLMQHYERSGEKWVNNILRTETTLDQWLLANKT